LYHLKNLRLRQFKNHAASDFEFAPKLNCFVGDNGMGKTNVLDAIFFTCLTKSYSGLSDAALIQHDTDFFRIDATFEHKNDEQNNEGQAQGTAPTEENNEPQSAPSVIITIKQPQKKKKTIENNGRIYERIAEHIGQYTVVMLSPDDPYTLMDGSEERRRFIDTAIAQTTPAYLQQLSLYNKVLEQRNALLKAALQSKTSPNAALMEVYDAQLVAPANFVFEQRKIWLAQFLPIFQTYYTAIAKDRETVACHYESALMTTDIATLLAQNYQRDCFLGRTTGGVHKDDIQLIINDLQLKKYASQGQLKSYTLALKLAQAEYIRATTQQPPILLLDDIFDKLDHQRVLHLLELLHQPNFGQLFITDTDKARILRLTADFGQDFRVFEVEKGGVKE
jgi:DNA replication and repair protein RecF